MSVEDPYGLGTVTSFVMIVGEMSVNYSPSFSNTIGLIEIEEKEEFEVEIPLCSDPEGETISLSLENQPSWVSILDGKVKGIEDEVGSFEVLLVCSDGENETRQSFSIDVLQIEEFKNPVVTIISIIIAIILLLILLCILIIVYCSSH